MSRRESVQHLRWRKINRQVPADPGLPECRDADAIASPITSEETFPVQADTGPQHRPSARIQIYFPGEKPVLLHNCERKSTSSILSGSPTFCSIDVSHSPL